MLVVCVVCEMGLVVGVDLLVWLVFFVICLCFIIGLVCSWFGVICWWV